MKAKELARQVRNKVVEIYKAGLGFKNYLMFWTFHGILLNPLNENGKSMVQLQTYHHKVVHAKERINQKSNQEAQGKVLGSYKDPQLG